MSDGFVPTHVAFLRSINVGGRRLKMPELVAACAALQLGEVRTWQATGNLVFSSDLTSAELEARLPEVLEQALGIDVPCVVRTAEEVAAIAEELPFTDGQLAATAGKIQLLLVRDEPDVETREAVLAHATADDLLQLEPGVLWWLPSEGVSTSSMNVRAIERLLGVCTMRSHRAVIGLAAKHLA